VTPTLTEQSKISEFDLKLMEIEADALGIPDTEYQAVIKMPAAEFQRICRDLTILGDTGSFSSFLFSYDILTHHPYS